ncbi:MAG: hypothetical protein CMJ18_12065 [Phycisphaeraceae bacterium]|nr:hypothetical protein [Phycisphaeraceae bacterium]
MYLQSAHRGVDWALSLLDERGAFRGTGCEVDCYRKAPRTLALSGRVVEAQRVADYLRRTFASPTGDFNQPGESGSRHDNTYRNAWLCWGMHDLGAYDLAVATARHLARIQNPETGGMPMSPETPDSDQIVSWGTTSLCIAALVANGRLYDATCAGRAMSAILDAQPEPDSAFYLCTDWSGALITDFAPEVAPLREIRFGAEINHYWSLGAGMAALVMLHLATGDEQWLTAARKVFDLAAHGRPDTFHATSSPKIIWGCTQLYAATREDVYLQAAIEIADDFVERQTPEGTWLGGAAGSYASLDEQPVPMSLDLAFDRSQWMLGLARFVD